MVTLLSPPLILLPFHCRPFPDQDRRAESVRNINGIIQMHTNSTADVKL